MGGHHRPDRRRPALSGLPVGQALPSESTIRRVLQDLDPTGLNTLLRSWLCTRTGSIEGRTVIAARRHDHPWRSPGAGVGASSPVRPGPGNRRRADPGAGGGQVQPEVPSLPVLLEPLDLDGAVVTADAMHAQVDTAEWITRRDGHYLLTPLGNQKTLRRTLKNLPWKSVPSVSGVDTSRGRRVRRRLLGDRGPAPRRSGTWSSTRGPPPATHRQWPTDRGRRKEPGHPASSGWSTAPPSPSPQPPDPNQDTPKEPSSSLPKPPPKPTLPTPGGEVPR
ncbi:Transposase [Actinomyces viscosus]|uniref:Transposase n=1 Tax=Actinomyces viscosus TaxID=1656 RepID=A0A448PN07_ACTVI|nr:Transposase [Actinomyces viscosus]